MLDSITPLALVLGIVGAAWGVVSDRLATRWPEHEEGVEPRGLDWRTATCAAIGGLAMAALPSRYSDPPQLALFAAWFLALTTLLATDLDQRLLPDVITLPLIPLAAIAALSGVDPLPHDAFGLVGAVAVAVLIPLGMYLLSIPFGEGAIGGGDLKLLVSVGLLSGLVRTITGVVAGALTAGIVIFALLVARRITLKSFIPFGPFLVLGAFWAVLVRFG
jgi:leader peptidase (prepilin peptidase)/N-methyltransferase